MKLYEGEVDLEVVGESFHQPELRALVDDAPGHVRVPSYAILVPEANNPYDENAVAVWVAGLLVGHLSRDDAAALRPGIVRLVEETDQAVAVEAVIVGGGPRPNGEQASLGVWLRHDPEAFGLPPEPSRPAPQSSGLRTGRSEALLTDEIDDSYDLSWLDALPDQPNRRLPRLRELMQRETDPVSRHYLMCALEADLYSMRDVHPGILDEYDEVATRHDSEMDLIRPALVAKFNCLPLLETYKQATIRFSKAGALDRALWWANRGVEVYAADAHDQAWIADLQKRAAVLEAKIERSTRGTVPAKTPRSGSNPRPPKDAMETLVCRVCGSEFTRVRTRGRKPERCPTCSGS